MRDTENVPLSEDVETYFKREVLPHAPDAWIDHEKTKVGYEIPFNRHFYVFEPPRPLAEIDADLKHVTGSHQDDDRGAGGMSFPTYNRRKRSHVGWLGDVPEHWEVCSLKRIVRLKSGEGITSDAIEAERLHPVYGGNGLRGYTSLYTHDGCYVLIGRQGALCGNVNYASGKFWASEHAVVATPSRQVETRWLGELLRAMNLNQYSISAAQPGLAVDTLNALQVPLPPLPEQGAIAAFLDLETAKIDALDPMFAA